MSEPQYCQCGHTKEQHDARTKGCMHIASVPSRAKKQYGKGRNRYIKCDCKRYRLLVSRPEEEPEVE
jgi:hypothetical protein